MSDSKKTKRELESELKTLRRRLDELQSKTKTPAGPKKHLPRNPREKMSADLEFIGDFDLIKAKAVNVSDGGICFKTSANLPFEMRYKHDGKLISRRAHLIWLKHAKNGGYNFGLKFVNKKKYPQF